jgi:acid phosphatase type 7
MMSPIPAQEQLPEVTPASRVARRSVPTAPSISRGLVHFGALGTLSLLLACPSATGDPPTDPPPLDCGPRSVAGEFDGLTRAPYLQNPRHDGITVAWGGRVDSTGLLRWWSSTDSGEIAPTGRTQPAALGEMDLLSATIGGLQPATRHCYAVDLNGAEVASGLEFTTAPTDGSEVTFFAFGDMGQGTTVQADVAERMSERAAGTHLLLTTGDNAYADGSYQQFDDFVFAYYRDLLPEMSLMPTLGNHDYNTPGAQPYLDNFFLPENAWREADRERYWSMDYGPLHVIGLDSEESIDGTGDDSMLAWADADLEANTKPWTVALWHRPPWSGGTEGDGSLQVRDLLVPLMQEHGVDLVLMGHEHFYERFAAILDGAVSSHEEGGVTYVISGGGGNFLGPVNDHPLDVARAVEHHFVRVAADECALGFEAINDEGQTFDAFSLDRC